MHPLLQNWYIDLATGIFANTPDNEAGWTEQVDARHLFAAGVAGKYQVKTLENNLKELLASSQAAGETRAAAAVSLIEIAPEKNAGLIAEALYDVNEPVDLRQ